jgi:pimeloyl-ACP methyl ester carboxylesterase
MSEPGTAFVAVDELRLHYLEWSHVCVPTTNEDGIANTQESDNLPLVMLHGLGANADSWRLVASYLCKQHPVFAFDLRGHGQSDHALHDYKIATIAEDIVGGMAALGLGQVALIGHGWGARVALGLAARHPALISHLILVDCPHVEPRHWPDMTRERFIHEHDTLGLYASREEFLTTMEQEMYTYWSPEVEQIVLTYVWERPDGCMEEVLHADAQTQIRAALWEDRALSYYGKLRCPVLLVPAAAQPRPDEEPPEYLETAEEFAAAKGYMAAQVARAIQRCSVLWMPDTAHDIQLQRPKELAQAIAQFLQ